MHLHQTCYLSADGSNDAVYQALNVIQDKEYTFSGRVKGAGCVETWFEVIFG